MYIQPDQLASLPLRPGIYKLCDKSGTVLYVGKAKQLRNRVRSYFRKTGHDIKTRVMMRHVTQVEIIETSTENEAFILENQLIKSLKPKYNILLKDDKTFPYIKVTVQEPFPRIIVTRIKQNDGARYYGPFPSMGSSRSLKKTLYELFPLRDCKLNITLTEHQPKCILLDIGKCLGPCVIKDIKPAYDDIVKQLHMLLTGKDQHLIKRLKTDMKSFSDQHAYEKAAQVRDKIQLLERLTELQRVDINDTHSYQLWAYVQRDGMMYVMVQYIKHGKLLGQNGYYDDFRGIDMAQDFIERCFKHHAIKGIALLANQAYADCVANKHITVPQRGIKKELIQNVERNASMALLRVLKQRPIQTDDIDVLDQIQQTFNLSRYPSRIVGCDISHLQGSNMVGSAVTFVDGKPDKSGYRQFNIKTVQGHSHDPQALKEVVIRYIKLCQREGTPLPDLLLIDGGKGQLNFAYSALAQLEQIQHIDLLSLAKRNEEVYKRGEKEPVICKRNHPALQLLQHVRDESHRFALKQQRQKRKKEIK